MKHWVWIIAFILSITAVQAAEPELLPRAYLPLVVRGPEQHRVKAALSRAVDVPCDTVWDYGAEWVSNWWELCGATSSAMIRDLGQWERVQAGEIDLSEATMPVQMFNEPENQDCGAGACMTMAELITATHEIITAYPDKELTSPAFLPRWVGGDYGLLDWVDGYHAEYGEYPRFEVLAMHAYDSSESPFASTAGDYDHFMAELAARGYSDLRVWVTEMGWWEWEPERQDVQERAAGFLRAWLDKCDADSRCEYVNWFCISCDGYGHVMPLELGGELTLAGQVWLERFGERA